MKAKTIYADQTAKTTKLAVTAMLAALAAVLMFFEFPLGFIAPSFYEFDFSEVPVLVGTFSMGPVAGVVIEFIKILVKFLIKGTSTGGVGELANFVIGCAFILPAGFIYKYKKTRIGAIVGMLTGTVAMAVVGVFFNAYVLVPMYSAFMPLEEIIAMGQAIVPAISSTFTFCLYCVGPFNIVKGLIISILVFCIYKPISRLISSLNRMLTKKKVKDEPLTTDN
ncbi:MAG: ECF transporter S component [Clostridiales bacterium]|nr:ECF transporter S component [Clostridiales bacterium]